MTSGRPRLPAESLLERRARVERRLAAQRSELAAQWSALEQRTSYQERRFAGIARGFRAVLPLGAFGGAVWLLRRFGPARVVQPVMFGLAAWRFLRRHKPRLA